MRVPPNIEQMEAAMVQKAKQVTRPGRVISSLGELREGMGIYVGDSDKPEVWSFVARMQVGFLKSIIDKGIVREAVLVDESSCDGCDEECTGCEFEAR